MKRVDNDKLEAIEKELTNQLLELIYMGMSKDDVRELIERLYENLKKED